MDKNGENGVEAKDEQDLLDILAEMTHSASSAREAADAAISKVGSPEFDMTEGISLLGLKHHLMLDHLQSLTLLSCHRTLGTSVVEAAGPMAKFSDAARSPRGDEPADLVDALSEGRVVLDKIKILETRMKYQIEKLVRLATQSTQTPSEVVEDPLAFRPNLDNLMAPASDDEDAAAERAAERSGVYRPPKLAPMPYTEKKDKKKRQPVPQALSAIAHTDPFLPHQESSTGLGGTPSHSSTRARELQHMVEFEEANMTRLVLNKREAKRRKADEEHMALGGIGAARGKARGGDLRDEFADLLRERRGKKGDGYDELRAKGRKQGVLERSRVGKADKESMANDDDSHATKRKRGRFEKDVRASKKRRSG